MPAAPSMIRSLMGAGRRADAAPAPLRPAGRRAAPRALAWGAAVFSVVQLGLGLASELYPRIRDPLYGDKLIKLQRRLPGDRTPTVVMLGSSRTGLAFHGKHAEQVLAGLNQPAVAFNFGVPASGPVTHLVYLNRLLSDGVSPDLVLVEVMPSMLTDGPGAPLEKNWFHPDRLTFAERDTVIRHGYPADDVRARCRPAAGRAQRRRGRVGASAGGHQAADHRRRGGH